MIRELQREVVEANVSQLGLRAAGLLKAFGMINLTVWRKMFVSIKEEGE